MSHHTSWLKSRSSELPEEYKKGEKYFKIIDELPGIRDWLTQHMPQDILKIKPNKFSENGIFLTYAFFAKKIDSRTSKLPGSLILEQEGGYTCEPK